MPYWRSTNVALGEYSGCLSLQRGTRNRWTKGVSSSWSKFAISNGSQTYCGRKAIVDPLEETRGTEIAASCLLVMMTIRLPGVLTRETLGGCGDEKDETGQRFQTEAAPSSNANPFRDIKGPRTATSDYHTTQPSFVGLFVPVLLLLCRNGERSF